MDDPQRLLDGTGTALERTLLQELRSYDGPESMRAHTLAALGVTGSTGLAAAGVLAWLWGRSWSTKLLLTASVTSVLLSVPAAYPVLGRRSTPAALHPSPTVAASLPVSQLPTSASLPPIITPANSAVLDTPNSPPPHPATRLSRRNAMTSTDLRAELDALDTVRATLGRGELVEALSILDAYFQNFHHGRLHLEAEILRIDALARCGQTGAARSYAEDFLRRHSKSVYAARLQSIVGH